MVETPAGPLEPLFRKLHVALQMEDVTVMVITGALEKAFIAGADIKEMASQGAAGAENFAKLRQGANNILNRMKKIVSAAINGDALGGGELARACDYRLMRAGKPLIGLPEADLGIAVRCRRHPAS